MTRRYFILNRISPDELEALESCIGELWTQRYSLDGSKILIKTNDNHIKKYLGKDTSKLGKEHTLEEIKVIMKTPEWQSDDLI